MAGRIRGIFRQQFDLLPDAVVVTDTQGTIVYFDKRAEQLFGYSEDKVIGLPLKS